MNGMGDRERLTEVLAAAVADWNTLGTDRVHQSVSDHLTDALLASAVLARLLADARAEAWRASRLDLAHELRESGAWSEVRMAEWVEMRADRAALTREAL